MLTATEINSFAKIKPENLDALQIEKLQSWALPEELGRIAREALAQQPPNTEMSSFVAGICVPLSGKGPSPGLSHEKRKRYASAAGGVVPAMNEIEVGGR